MNANLQLLKAVPLFQGFSERDLEALAQRASLKQVRDGEHVFEYGDAGASMFVIVSGMVDVVLPPAETDGTPTVLQRLGPGDFFGEMALLDNQPRMAGIEVVADTELLELTRENFLEQLRLSPQLVPAMLSVMSNRLRLAAKLLGTPTARNINKEADDKLTWAQRLADTVARWNGSWAFILVLGALSTMWMLSNGIRGIDFDPYPYQFYNLFLAILVALQGPLIMMSQNRQVAKERLHAEADYMVNLKNETGIHQILHELAEVRAELATIQQERKPDRA